MNTFKKLVVTTALACCSLFGVEAQDLAGKPSCKPTSCGPGGTKVAESAIITHLRTEVISLEQVAQSKSLLPEKSNDKSDTALYGSNEDESLSLISDYLGKLHLEVVSQIPGEKLHTGIQGLDFNTEVSGAKLVSRLLQNVILLQEQVRAL